MPPSGPTSPGRNELAAATLWRAAQTRFFIVPDDAALAPGEFAIRTTVGHERRVREDDLRAYEVTREAALAWLQEQLDPAVTTIKAAVAEGALRLQEAADRLQGENEATQQELGATIAAVREAASQFVDSFSEQWKTLKEQAARGETEGTPSVAQTLDAFADLAERLANDLQRKRESIDKTDAPSKKP